MKDLKAIFGLLSNYKCQVWLSLMCHVLMAVFTVISIPLIIPFFHFLFSTTPAEATLPDSYMDVLGWLEYWFVRFIDTQGPQNALIATCIFLMLVFFLKNLFRYLGLYFMIPVRSGIVSDLRNGLYKRYMDLPEIQDTTTSRGDLLSRLTSDVQEIEFSVLRFIQSIFKAPIIIIGSVALMLSIHVGLTMFVFVLMFFTVLVIGTLSKTLKKQSSSLQASLSSLNSIADETLDGRLLMKVFRVKEVWLAKFRKQDQTYRSTYHKVVSRQELSSPLSEFLGVTVVIVLLWYGAQLVFREELRPEAFFAFVFAFYHVIEPLKSFSTAYYNINRGAASLERIQAMTITQDSERDIDKATKTFSFENELRFDSVSFAYEARMVLDRISFSLTKGQKLAIVGDSGAGKSTIVSLLLKVLRPQKGQIKIDGINLADINTDSLYQNIGLVTQQAFLFNGTIEDNVKMGRSGMSEAAVNRSIKMSDSTLFTEQKRKGITTRIGDRGQTLSGGEKQRLTIARALLEDPDILILDEPTSSLDPSSESRISKAIVSAMTDRTAIIIAHRLSTIRFADKILFLDRGQIIEQGSHAELMQLEGRYYDYVRLQSID